MPNPVFIKRKILFGDCDPAGIVYTPKFSYFAVEAIDSALDVWLAGPGLRTLMGFNVLPPVRAFSLEFLRPLTWDDEITLKVSVENIGVHSFTFSVEGFLKNEALSFNAHVTHVCISPETKEVIAIPEALKELLS